MTQTVRYLRPSGSEARHSKCLGHTCSLKLRVLRTAFADQNRTHWLSTGGRTHASTPNNGAKTLHPKIREVWSRNHDRGEKKVEVSPSTEGFSSKITLHFQLRIPISFHSSVGQNPLPPRHHHKKRKWRTDLTNLIDICICIRDTLENAESLEVLRTCPGLAQTWPCFFDPLRENGPSEWDLQTSVPRAYHISSAPNNCVGPTKRSPEKTV